MSYFDRARREDEADEHSAVEGMVEWERLFREHAPAAPFELHFSDPDDQGMIAEFLATTGSDGDRRLNVEYGEGPELSWGSGKWRTVWEGSGWVIGAISQRIVPAQVVLCPDGQLRRWYYETKVRHGAYRGWAPVERDAKIYPARLDGAVVVQEHLDKVLYAILKKYGVRRKRR